MRDPPKSNSFRSLSTLFEAAHLKLDIGRQKYNCMLALVSCNLSTNLINCKIKIYPTNDRKVRSRTSLYGHSLNSDTSLLRTLFFVPGERKPLMFLSPHFSSGQGSCMQPGGPGLTEDLRNPSLMQDD